MIWWSLKEKRVLLELLEDALIRGSQHVVDLGSLVHLVGSRKQRVQTEKGVLLYSLIGSKRASRNEFTSVSVQTSPHDLEEDAASAPHVHLKAVVAVGQEALRGSVPAGGDVLRVRGLGINAPTRAEVAELQAVLLQRSIWSERPRWNDPLCPANDESHLDQNVFRLHVSVKDPTAGRQTHTSGGHVSTSNLLSVPTCACVRETCKAGTCSSSLCGQARVFFVLECKKVRFLFLFFPPH